MLIVADRLTSKDTRHIASLASRERLLLQLLCVQSQTNRLSSSVWTLSAAYSDGGVIIVEWSDCVEAQQVVHPAPKWLRTELVLAPICIS